MLCTSLSFLSGNVSSFWKIRLGICRSSSRHLSCTNQKVTMFQKIFFFFPINMNRQCRMNKYISPTRQCKLNWQRKLNKKIKAKQKTLFCMYINLQHYMNTEQYVPVKTSGLLTS